MGSDDEFDQLVFRDGRLVTTDSKDAPSELRDPDPVTPNQETGFTVEIKPGALEVNEALADIQEEHGEILSFGSKSKAEAFAEQVSTAAGPLRIQAAAPNDPNDVDGYLLAQYDRSVKEPASTDDGTWTFDVGANLYGALGETVVTSGAKPPALEYFVKQDLGTDFDDLDFGLRISVNC